MSTILVSVMILFGSLLKEKEYKIKQTIKNYEISF